MADFDTSVPHIARVYGVTRLFDGLDLVEPGVVRAPEWRPSSDLAAASPAVLWAGMARKP